MITTVPKAVFAISKAEGTSGSEAAKKQFAMASASAELAQREISSDFALLYALASISLWGSLESMVHDLVRGWICNRPEILSKSPWSNLKVRIGEYEALDTEQRAYYLVEMIDQSVSGPLKHGVSRFEALLATIGLDGSVPDELRRNLFELQQVRNVLVHRRGIADQRLCKSCPWMKLKSGQPVSVGHKAYDNYVTSVLKYVMELIYRTGEHFGISNMRENSSGDDAEGEHNRPADEEHHLKNAKTHRD